MKKNLRKLCERYKTQINDIIIFGSYARQEKLANDIDLAVIFYKEDAKTTKEVLFSLKGISEKIHFNWLTLGDLFGSSLFPTLLEEGFSIMKNRYLYEEMGYSTHYFFTYGLTNLSNSRKVLFSYALNGHNTSNGLLKILDGERFGRNTVIIPLKNAREFKEFLDQWEVKYSAKRALVK